MRDHGESDETQGSLDKKSMEFFGFGFRESCEGFSIVSHTDSPLVAFQPLPHTSRAAG
jgi:hypothetical protein